MTADLRDRCHQTDLLVAECAHCRLAPAPTPALDMEGMEDLDLGDAADVGPVFTASYYSTCPECQNRVEPGDQARMVDGEATHEECT